jgi:hypothetical protein
MHANGTKRRHGRKIALVVFDTSHIQKKKWGLGCEDGVQWKSTCQSGLKDVLIRASKSGDISGSSAHIKPNQLQLLSIIAMPLGGEGIAHVAPSRARQNCPVP